MGQLRKRGNVYRSQSVMAELIAPAGWRQSGERRSTTEAPRR
jgi:hypothetical protein